jgi:ATP-binding cassette subfamily B multidrug efflux pump
MAETPHDEEILGKAFELRLARRLFSLVRPYRRYVVGSVVVLLLESLAQLAGPLLMAAAIDLLFT